MGMHLPTRGKAKLQLNAFQTSQETYIFNKRIDDTFEVIPNPGAPSFLIQWGLDISVSQIKHILKQQKVNY